MSSTKDTDVPAQDWDPSNTRKTERAFISAATTLFASKGYNGTSISDLAKELGLTTASLYYHVQGKQELLLRVLEMSISDFLVQLEDVAASDGSPREKLTKAIHNHLDFVLERPEAVAVFLRERRFLESPYRENYQKRVQRYDHLFASLIIDCIKAGEFPPLDPDLARLAILGMINWIAEWYDPNGRLTAQQVKDQMSELILDRLLDFS